MTDLELSKALALAIGWKTAMLLPSTACPSLQQCWVYTGNKWRAFDYRDPLVIWPIAERYNCFPYALRDAVGFTGRWNVLVNGLDHDADTAAKAVALAAIRNTA